MLAMLSLSGLVVSGSTLVVVGCNSQRTENIPKIKKSDEFIIVQAINNASYAITVLINSSVTELKNQINANFIKAKLEQKNKKNFNTKDFSFVTILNEDDKEITREELSFKRDFLAKIIYHYGTMKNQKTNLVINVDDDAVEQPVVKEIKKIKYSINAFTDNTVDELKTKITPGFIKQQLSKENQNIFRDDKFKLNKITKDGRELNTKDLQNLGIIEAQINYDYGAIKNQKTNLIIDVDGNWLKAKFKNFQFTDSKGVNGFIDNNDITYITNQIKKHLEINDLSDVKVSLQNLTSNSVTLIGSTEAGKYKGEVTLTWNLKLFEVYGTTTEAKNKWVSEGLRGYFYLTPSTNDNSKKQIKYFDAVWYFNEQSNMFNIKKNTYHSFEFLDNYKNKDFTFQGYYWNNEIAELFGSFDFTTEVKVTVDSPELERIKIFNKANKEWKGLMQETKFEINNLGQIRKV